jgi:hypothetical protein
MMADKRKDTSADEPQLPEGQDAEPGTPEHLGSDRPYEGAAPEDEGD